MVLAVARSARIAAEEAHATADLLAALPSGWREQAGRPKAGTAAARLIDALGAEPIFTTDEVERRLGVPTASAYRAVERLASAGIVRRLTDRRRNQVWGAADVLDELDDLGVRIGVRARRELG